MLHPFVSLNLKFKFISQNFVTIISRNSAKFRNYMYMLRNFAQTEFCWTFWLFDLIFETWPVSSSQSWPNFACSLVSVAHFVCDVRFDLNHNPDLVHKVIFACFLIPVSHFWGCPIWFGTLPGSRSQKLTYFSIPPYSPWHFLAHFSHEIRK
jgi:hypothetical protein